MKNFNPIFKREIEHEQYYANVVGDAGAETYMGIARAIFPNSDIWPVIDEYKKIHGEIKHNTRIESITLDSLVIKHYTEYWQKCGIDRIKDFSLQYIIFDFAVNSVRTWAKKMQALLGVKTDGIIGNKTIGAINDNTPEHLFNIIKYVRIQYYHELSKKGQNAQFLNGWLKRIRSINYEK